MNRLVLSVVLALSAGSAGLAQRHRLGEVNAETPEGQFLQQIGQEADPAKKMTMLEDFTVKFPKHEGVPWVLSQLQTGASKAGNHDKVIEAGEKLLALDPLAVETAHLNLKAAEAKKDPELVKKWAGQVSDISRKVVASKKPEDEEEAEEWTRLVDFSKQVDTYAEYSLFAMGLSLTDPAAKIDLFEALEQRYPEGKYKAQTTPMRFLLYRQLNDNAKAVAVAEKVLATDQSHEDMLIVVADDYLQKKREPEKVIEYSNKVAELMATKAKPEGVSDDDWNKKKTLYTGLAHSMAGRTYAIQNKWAQVDKSFRAALPHVEGNNAMKGEAYFYLGLANYRMEKIIEAIAFNKQCVAIKGPYQAQAAKNLKVIQSQYRTVK